MRALLVVAVVACSGPGFAPEPDLDAPASRALGLDDVSVLLPLPADPATPVLLPLSGSDGALAPTITSAILALMNIEPRDGDPYSLDQFQVVAVRFDLCMRESTDPCFDTQDGVVRLVLQPVYANATGVTTHDVALHAFYPIPVAELAGVIAELRELAVIHDIPTTAPLAVDPAAPAYLERLRALVLRYARADKLERMTVIGQKAGANGVHWLLRGVDVDATGALTAMTIPGIDDVLESLDPEGGDTVFVDDPLVDAPAGFALALDGLSFDAASMGDKLAALQTVVAIDNPSDHDAFDLQCTACHVSTFLTTHRSMTAGVDPASIAGTYQTSYDVSVSSLANTDPRVVRAFGWVGTNPIISIRVANESARVATEIQSRFPGP